MVRVTIPKNLDVNVLLFVRSIWFIAARVVIRTCDTCEMELFPKIVYSLKSLIILTRSSILRSITGCWIYLEHFFRLTFSVCFFFLLTFLNINWRRNVHTNVCSPYILEALHWVWDLSKFGNRDTIIISFHLSCHFDVLFNFDQVFALFLGTILLFVYCECYKCYLMTYLYGIPIRRYICESCSKTLVCNCTNCTVLLWYYLSISCFGDVAFKFYFFIAVLIGKTCSKLLIRFRCRIFYILLCFIADLKQVFTMLYSFNINHWNHFLTNIVNKTNGLRKQNQNISRNKF